mgnify:FL=1
MQHDREQLYNDIDNRIDQLVDQTARQNQNANTMGNELQSQITQAQEINNHMDKTQTKIDETIIQIGKIKTTKDQIVAWILSILLLIAIIIVWACA